jgi:hypothetical protein
MKFGVQMRNELGTPVNPRSLTAKVMKRIGH